MQQMEHSQVFRDIVAEIMASHPPPMMEAGHKPPNLSAKKHRFEKCSTPMAKGALWSKCLILGCVKVVLTRAGPLSLQTNCKAFLAQVDTEATHSLFNLAEQGDDGLLLVRFFDTEEIDPAQT